MNASDQNEGEGPRPGQAAALRLQFSLSTTFLYTTCFCVVIAVRLFELRSLQDLYETTWPGVFSGWFRVSVVVQSALVALAVVGAFCVLTSSLTTNLWQPGHWIMLISGATGIISLVTSFVMAEYFNTDIPSNQSAGAVANALHATVSGTGCVIAVFRLQGLRAWQMFFGYQVSLCAAIIIGQSVSFVGTSSGFRHALLALTAGNIVFLAIAAYQDIAHKLPRDELHWMGIVYIGVAHSMLLAAGLL